MCAREFVNLGAPPLKSDVICNSNGTPGYQLYKSLCPKTGSPEFKWVILIFPVKFAINWMRAIYGRTHIVKLDTILGLRTK